MRCDRFATFRLMMIDVTMATNVPLPMDNASTLFSSSLRPAPPAAA